MIKYEYGIQWPRGHHYRRIQWARAGHGSAAGEGWYGMLARGPIVFGTGKNGYDLQGPDARRLMGDPDDVARMIEYILQQPIDLNLEEVVIRPAVSIDMA